MSVAVLVALALWAQPVPASSAARPSPASSAQPVPASSATRPSPASSATRPSDCAPCHATLPRAHRALAQPHPDVACVGCHRGVAAQTSSVAAHGVGADALLAGAHTAAACTACHVIGVRGTERLVRGVDVYLAQGCAMCHRALGQGPPVALGPALDTAGFREPAALRGILERPSTYYPRTPMPPYAWLFQHHAADAEALLVFLRSLRGTPRPSAGPAAAVPCATCHATPVKAGAAPVATTTTAIARPPLVRHACVRLRAEAAELGCARCHGDAVPAGPRECLYVEGRRPECAACHEVPR